MHLNLHFPNSHSRHTGYGNWMKSKLLKWNFRAILLLFFMFYFQNVYSSYYWQVTSIASFTGGGSYAQNSAASPLVLNLNQCAGGISQPHNSTLYNITWYQNTVNSTTGGTVVYSTSVGTPFSFTAQQSYTPSTSVGGTFYYYAVLSNPLMTTCGFTGTLTSTIQTVVVSSPGAALNFSNSHVNLGTSITNQLTGTNNVTVEAWVYPTSNSGLGNIVGNYNTSTWDGQYRVLLRRDNSNYGFYIGNGTSGGTASSAANTVNLNTWQHIVGTWDGTTVRLFINGVLAATASCGGTFAAFTHEVWIGGNSMGSENFAGNIDEVRIWNRPLCGGEIQNNMNCELSASGQTGLMGLYHFDEGFAGANNSSIDTLFDASGNGINGTLTNFTLTGSTSNWVAIGGVSTGTSCSAFTPPSISASSNSSVNAGSSINLTSTSGFTSYTWTGPNSFTSTSQNPTIPNAIAADTGTYTVTGTNSVGCSNTVTTSVSVNPPAAALNFDKNDDLVNLGTQINLANQSFTIEAWAYRNVNNYYDVIFGGGSPSTDHGLFMGYNNANGFSFAFYADDLNTSSTFASDINSWHHWACVYNANTTSGPNRFIYRDGVLVASNRANNYVGTTALAIGQNFWGGGTFGGSIDEVRIWNRALCQGEIQNNMSCELNPTGQTGLLALYHFNEGFAGANNTSVDTLFDASGNGRNGILTNFTLNSSTENWVASGAVTTGNSCSAYILPTISASSNSTVNTGNSLNLRTTSGFASYAWTGPNGFTSTSQNPTISNATLAAAGTYSVTGTTSGGCTATATTSVSVLLDTDGDGIPDINDADADNDGILNIAECNKSNFYWSSAPSVSGYTATGTINGIAYTYTSSQPVTTTTYMYGNSVFPASYNVPNSNPTIKNIYADNNTLTFASPMTNPVLVFASIGQSGLSVPITFSAPIQLVWSQNVVQNSTTQITGTEGYAIIRLMGTFSSISFNYLTAENWCNFSFGADFQSCGDDDNDGIPNYLDIDSDNDGCPDAIEGSMHFAITQTQNGRLTGSVNSQGIPMVAGSGQGIGTSEIYNANCFCQAGIDQTAPTVFTKNISVNLNASGSATITASQIDSGSTDNCSIASYSLNKTSFDCSNVGANTDTLTVTDVNGNVSSTTATVTVHDNIAPIVVTQNVTAYLDANGSATITTSQVNNGSTDNCGVASVSLSTSSFTCSNVSVASSTQTQTIVTDNTWMKSSTTTSSGNFCTSGFWNGISTLPSVSSYTVTPTINSYSVTLIPGTQGIYCLNDVTYYRKTFNLTSIAGIQATLLASVDNAVQIFINGTPIALEGSLDGANFSDNIFNRIILNSVGSNVNGGSGFQNYDNITSLSASNLFVVGTNEIILAVANCSGGDRGAVSFKATIQTTPMSTTPVTLTVNDIHGNSGTGLANITVLDTIKPTVVTQNIDVYLDSTGAASTSTTAVNNGSFDNCSIASMSLNQTSFNCSNVGANTDTLTVTDVNGNVSTAVAMVNVHDSISPTVVTQNVTAYLNSNGTATITAAQVNNNSTDNCSISTLSLSKTNFSCSDMSGGSGHALSFNGSSARVVATTSTGFPQGGSARTVEMWIKTTMTGVAALHSYGNFSYHQRSALYLVSGRLYYVGEFNDAWGGTTTVNDGNWHHVGYTLSGQTIKFYIDGVLNYTTTLPSYPSTSGGAWALSNTSSISYTREPYAGLMDELRVWATVRSATDIQTNYNKALTGSETNLVAYYNFDEGSGNTLHDLTANHNNGTLTNMNTGTCWVAGASISNNSQNVTLTVTDVNGNVSTGTATVTIIDSIKPTAIAQNVDIYLDATGAASTTTTAVNNGSYDNCSVATLSLSKTSFNCSNVGANTDTLTVTDANGNVSSTTATVTVHDNIAPTAIAQNVDIYLDAIGAASTSTTAVNNGSYDNCSIASLSLSKTSFNCSNVGANTDTLTVTDVNGNVSTTTATVTVHDNIAPTAIAQNVDIYLDSTGASSTSATAVNNGSFDNCSIASMSLSQISFNCSNVGANTDTLTVTDVNGNISSTTATVTVHDNITPTAIAQNVDIYLDSTGAASTSATAVNNGSFDNCSIASMSLSQISFNCSNVGANTDTLTVTDANGNVSSTTATVTVHDNIAPTAIAQNVDIYLDSTGASSTSATAVNNGSFDNCSIASMSLSQTSFNCSNVGINTDTLTVTDVNGNVSSTTATVTVHDNIAPTVVTQPLTIYLDTTGAATITASQINNGSTDNCSIATYSVLPNTFDCSNVGDNTVTLTVTDVNGNVSTATASVTVYDTIKPTVIAQNITVNLGSNATVGITPTQVDNGSFDNCTITTMTVSPDSFTCANIGNNTVTLTVTDANGNVSTATAVVTVQGENLGGSDAIIYINESNVVNWTNIPSKTDGNSGTITSTSTFNGNVVILSSSGGNIKPNTCSGIGVSGGEVEEGCTNTTNFKNQTINQDQSFKVTLKNSNLGIYKLVFESEYNGRVKVSGRRNGKNVISFNKYMTANTFDTFDFSASCALKGICLIDEVKFTLANNEDGRDNQNWDGHGNGHDGNSYGNYHEGDNINRDNNHTDYDDGSYCSHNCGFSVKFPIFFVKSKDSCGLNTAGDFEDDDNKVGSVVALTGSGIRVIPYTGITSGVNSDGNFTTGNPATSNYTRRILVGYDVLGKPSAWEVSKNCDFRSIRMGAHANKPQLPLGSYSTTYEFTVTGVETSGQYIYGTRKLISNGTVSYIRWRVTEFYQRAWVLPYEVYTPSYGKDESKIEQAGGNVSESATVDIYPNPSMDVFNIRINSTSDRLMDIVILDMTGKEIATFSNLSPGEAFVYNAANLKAAVYFVQVRQGEFTKVTKITKMN